jgi:hypothetical protein
MIVHVHVPKTGGASFNAYLENFYGKKRVFYVWGKGLTLKNPSYTKAVYGHVDALTLSKTFPNGELICWFRDPVERLCSAYWFYQRWDLEHIHEKIAVLIQKEDMSLIEFAEYWGNHVSRQMNGFQLRDFSFVGITEQSRMCYKAFSKMFWGKDIPPLYHNVNPQRGTDAYQLNCVVRKEMNKKNNLDRELYAEALSFWRGKNPRWTL